MKREGGGKRGGGETRREREREGSGVETLTHRQTLKHCPP